MRMIPLLAVACVAMPLLAASEEAYRTVTITLVSDVATTYLLLRQLDAQEKTATDTLASRRE